MKEQIRHCIFRPYLKDKGPIFHLYLYDTGKTDSMGKYRLAYRLTQGRTTIFDGEDFSCSPMHAIDGNETVKAVMGFLTLKPGDTDSEYFNDYTSEQIAYCDQHAESLQYEVMHRFGE